MGELGTDPGVIEAGADRVRLGNLAVLCLKNVRTRAVQHPGPALGERSTVLAALQPEACRLDAVKCDGGVTHESVQRTGGIRSAAHAGDDRVGKTPFGAYDLIRGLLADVLLQLTHHRR